MVPLLHERWQRHERAGPPEAGRSARSHDIAIPMLRPMGQSTIRTASFTLTYMRARAVASTTWIPIISTNGERLSNWTRDIGYLRVSLNQTGNGCPPSVAVASSAQRITFSPNSENRSGGMSRSSAVRVIDPQISPSLAHTGAASKQRNIRRPAFPGRLQAKVGRELLKRGRGKKRDLRTGAWQRPAPAPPARQQGRCVRPEPAAPCERAAPTVFVPYPKSCWRRSIAAHRCGGPVRPHPGEPYYRRSGTHPDRPELPQLQVPAPPETAPDRSHQS